jgi:hypothetical protein
MNHMYEKICNCHDPYLYYLIRIGHEGVVRNKTRLVQKKSVRRCFSSLKKKTSASACTSSVQNSEQRTRDNLDS